MDLGLTGKIAMVVGAGADVGRATAVTLAREGARVLLVGRSEENVTRSREIIASFGGSSEIAIADTRDAEAVRRLVAGHDTPDILVNTVGPFPRDVGESAPMYGGDESWARVFDTVFMTAVRICREVIPQMKHRGSGAVVNLAANSARYYHPQTAQYAAMKSALTHVTKNWARDAGSAGVRVNAVLPGWIKTDGMARMIEARAEGERKTAEAVEHEMVTGHDSIFWSGRMGRPQDYADAITFLVSDRASYINGALMPVDGGSPVW